MFKVKELKDNVMYRYTFIVKLNVWIGYNDSYFKCIYFKEKIAHK